MPGLVRAFGRLGMFVPVSSPNHVECSAGMCLRVDGRLPWLRHCDEPPGDKFEGLCHRFFKMGVARGRNCPSGSFGQKRGDPTPARAPDLCSDRVTIFLLKSRQFLFDFLRRPSVDIQLVLPVKEMSAGALESIVFG